MRRTSLALVLLLARPLAWSEEPLLNFGFSPAHMSDLSPYLSATVKTAGELTVHEFDSNRNGVIERRALYKDDDFLGQEYDRNEDGKVDLKYNFFGKDLILKKDDDFNGVFEVGQKLTPQDDNPHNYSKLVNLDQNQDGKQDKSFTLLLAGTKLELGEEECSQIEDELLKRFTQDAVDVVEKSEFGYHKTSYGVRIERKCVKLMDLGDAGEFYGLVRDAYQQGVQCLAKMGKLGLGKSGQNNNVPKSLENLSKINNMLKGKKPMTIECSSKMDDVIGGALAYGSSPGDAIENNKEVKHPFLKINPNWKAMTTGQLGTDKTLKGKLKQTIFHELLHTIDPNHLHGHSVDYSYTCDTCCTGASDYAQELKDLSCKVCAGDYKGPNDPEYFKDMTRMFKLDPRYEEAKTDALMIESLKANPEDVTTKFHLADYASGHDPKVGCYYLADVEKEAKSTPAEFSGRSAECKSALSSAPNTKTEFAMRNMAKILKNRDESLYQGSNWVPLPYVYKPKLLEGTIEGLVENYLAHKDDPEFKEKKRAQYLLGTLGDVMVNLPLHGLPPEQEEEARASMRRARMAVRSLQASLDDPEKLKQILAKYKTSNQQK